MTTINLTDGFGLVINASPHPVSLFSKYLKSPGAIVGMVRDTRDIKDLEVGQDPFNSLSVGISFKDQIDIGSSGVELTIGPQLLGSIAIKKGAALFDATSDPFGDSIVIPPNQAYVAAAVDAKLSAGLSDKTGDLQFGFSAGTDVTMTNYRLSAVTDKVVPAIQTLIEGFFVPGDLEDIQAMAPGQIATVDGAGSLQFSAKANLLSAVNPLAALNATVVQGLLNIKDSASVVVGATYTLTGEYQVRVQRLGGTKFQLGFQKKHGAELDVTVSADIGPSATVDGFDIIQTLLGAVSSDPVPDRDAFKKAGMTDAQIATIGTALKAGVERSLQLSIAAEWDSLFSTSAAFSYEIDLSALDTLGTQAVNNALSGNLSLLEEAPLLGIKTLKSLFSTLRQGKRILKINLLGIFNYASVATLFQKGTMIVDREGGQITITDQAGADRIQFTSDNFAADTAKLRSVLAQSLLLTVAYRTSGTLHVGPSFATTYSFFEMHQRTNLQNIKDYLNTAQAFGMVSSLDVSNRLASVASISAFGPSSFYANTSYNDQTSKSLFLDVSGKPRQQEVYERTGRFALQSLLPGGNPLNDARRLPLTDDSIWTAMKSIGQPNNFGGIFDKYSFNDNQLADITSDYTLIIWWSEAMSKMANALFALLTYIGQNPQWDPQNNTFKALRVALDKTMASVTKNTQDQFAEPWGLLVMYLASERQCSATLQLICSKLALTLSTDKQQAQAAKA